MGYKEPQGHLITRFGTVSANMNKCALFLVYLLTFLQVTRAAKKEDAAEYPGFPEPLTKANFKREMSEGLHVVEFYSPHCSHCKHLEPIWKKAWKMVDDEGDKLKISLKQVNCVESGDLCNREKIAYFPTIRLYNRNGVVKSYPSNAKRTAEGLFNFAKREVANSENYDDEILNNESVLFEDIDFIDLISGKGKDPYLISFWPANEMKNLNSDIEFYDCEECNPFQRTWKKLSKRLPIAGIKTAHLSCVEYSKLCKQLGFNKLTKLQTMDDTRNPMVALVLPNKTTNNLFIYKDKFTTDSSKYETFAKNIYENSQAPEISIEQLKTITAYDLDFEPDNAVPIDEQNIHVVFSYDPKTVVSEDFEILEYLIEPLAKMHNVHLYKSNDDVLGFVKTAYDAFYEKINYNTSEPRKVLDENYFTLATLTQKPTFVIFKDGDLKPQVFHGYSTTEMRNDELILKWIKKNSLPLVSKVDSTSIDKLVNFDTKDINTLEILCVNNTDTKERNENRRRLGRLIVGTYDFDNTRMKHMYEKILKRREKKADVVKALKEKEAKAGKIVSAMRLEILHEDNLKSMLGYADLADLEEVLFTLMGEKLDLNVRNGDVIIIDKEKRQLYTKNIYGQRLDAQSPYIMRETLLSINIPEKSENKNNLLDYIQLKIANKGPSKLASSSFSVLKIIVVLAISVIVFVTGKDIYKNYRTNKSYKAKRNTVGLLGSQDKKNFLD